MDLKFCHKEKLMQEVFASFAALTGRERAKTSLKVINLKNTIICDLVENILCIFSYILTKGGLYEL